MQTIQKTESVNETPTKEAGVSQCKLQVTYISVVVTPMMVLIPRATRIVAMTPGPIVLVIIVVTVTRSDIDAARPNLYADVGSRRSGVWNRRYTQEGNSGSAY